MKKFERRATGREILSLPPAPGYLTAEGRGKRIVEKEYFEKCVSLLNGAARKHPGYKVRMSIKNGIPRFSYYQKSLTDQAISRRITRTLSNVKKDVMSNRSKEEIVRRINRTLENVEAMLWEK